MKLPMKTVTVFKNSHGTYAIRIPKKYRIPTKEVSITKSGAYHNPKPISCGDLYTSHLKISDDFSMNRNQNHSQQR